MPYSRTTTSMPSGCWVGHPVKAPFLFWRMHEPQSPGSTVKSLPVPTVISSPAGRCIVDGNHLSLLFTSVPCTVKEHSAEGDLLLIILQ
uniref:Uncharacterized protein n=1 Tax=Anguilla anguilla TaxID=7936 RepID=A0A0E9Q7E1_ANGAN